MTAWLDETPPQGPPLPSLTGAVVRLHRTLIAGITASLFLGGWLLPGLSPSAQDGSLGLQLVGALWLLAKTGLVLFGLACVRFAATKSTVEQRSSSVARLILPASIATLAGSLLLDPVGPVGHIPNRRKHCPRDPHRPRSGRHRGESAIRVEPSEWRRAYQSISVSVCAVACRPFDARRVRSRATCPRVTHALDRDRCPAHRRSVASMDRKA